MRTLLPITNEKEDEPFIGKIVERFNISSNAVIIKFTDGTIATIDPIALDIGLPRTIPGLTVHRSEK